ncbi:MAG TPA: hypothetical protein VLB09_03225, partial [Nitrospiria bacterium]|nr:hypothetical protein [Nitrospiria bacterium]
NVFLVYGLCRTLIGNSTLSYQPQSEWTTRYAPVLTAGFFAVHPLHAEAVAWIPGRNDVICATFVLVSFWVYVLSQHKRSRLVYFASMVLFFFALLSKEVAAGLLLIFPFYELVVRREGNKTKNLPSAVLRSVAFPVLIFGIYFWLRALKITGSNPSKALEGGESFPELGDIFSAAGYYFKSLAYPFPFRPFIAGLPGETGPAVFFALAWTGVLVWVFLRFPVWRGVLGIGVVWPWIFVVPALWVFISGVAATPLADRYAYIPSAGFLMASVILVLIGMDRIRSERMVILRKAGTGVLVASLGLMLVFWALENRERNTIWGSPLSFWRAAVISAPEAAYPKEQLGIFLGRAGKVNEAEESFKSALQLNPGPD